MLEISLPPPPIILLPSIQTQRALRAVRIAPQAAAPSYAPSQDGSVFARMEWSADQQLWSPAPLLWRLGKTFRGPGLDFAGGEELDIEQTTEWAHRMNVFPRLFKGAVYTFTWPFWVGISSALYDSGRDEPRAAAARSMMYLTPLKTALSVVQDRQRLHHNVIELLRWAQANNPRMAVWLDSWLEGTETQFGATVG